MLNRLINCFKVGLFSAMTIFFILAVTPLVMFMLSLPIWLGIWLNITLNNTLWQLLGFIAFFPWLTFWFAAFGTFIKEDYRKKQLQEK